jgi:hypothetical protein
VTAMPNQPLERKNEKVRAMLKRAEVEGYEVSEALIHLAEKIAIEQRIVFQLEQSIHV